MKQSLERHANILVEQAVAGNPTSSLKLPEHLYSIKKLS